MKSIIYYTNNRLDDSIFLVVQRLLSEVGLPIVSVSLKPINFGKNIVLDLEPGYTTMVKQILTALESSDSDVVFFCEHDVLYHPSHFDFDLPRDDIFYYNENNWRWKFPTDLAITYDRLISLSSLCANRKLALDHYKMRLETIEKMGWDKIKSREPRWARRMGYEPGTKKKKRGGLTDDDYETWRSEYPNVDIRHKGTFSPPKVSLDSFKHQPNNWQEINIDQIEGWDLRSLFDL